MCIYKWIDIIELPKTFNSDKCFSTKVESEGDETLSHFIHLTELPKRDFTSPLLVPDKISNETVNTRHCVLQIIRTWNTSGPDSLGSEKYWIPIVQPCESANWQTKTLTVTKTVTEFEKWKYLYMTWGIWSNKVSGVERSFVRLNKLS